MSNAKTKTITAELVTGKALIPAPPAPFAPSGKDMTRMDRIIAYHNATRLAEATKKIAAFFTGVELLQVKEELGYGKFLPWCDANLNPRGLSYRTAARYMAFAEPHLEKWLQLSQGPSATALQITNGLVTEDTFNAACDFLKDADDGKLFTELSRDFGLSRQPTHQKDRDNSKKQTPEETEASRKQLADNFAGILISNLGELVAENKSGALLRSDITDARWKELQDAILSASRIARDLLKNRRSNNKPAKVAKKGKRK